MNNEDTNKRCKPVVLNGVTYPSILAALKSTNTKINTYYCRIERGWTQEEALQGYRNSKVVKDKSGNVFKSLNAACEAHNITKSQYFSNLRLGMSTEEALDAIPATVKKPVTDAEGITYESIAEACKAHNIPYTRYVQRIRRGLTPAEALASTKFKTGKKVEKPS